MPIGLAWIAFAWIAALVGLAAAMHGSGSFHPPRPPAVNALARAINDSQPMAGRRWQWTATSAQSAMRALVVNVEAVDVSRARQIAQFIVERRGARYDEVLVYVHRVGSSRELAARRVSWTPRGGYAEIVYE